VYPLAAPLAQLALQVLRQTGKAIDSPEKSDWTDATLSSVKELSDVARSLGCEIELRLPGEGKHYGDVLAKITPYTFSKVSESAFITSRTSIFGRVERVGGATEMHCALRVAGRVRMVICRVVNADLVRELGRLLYQNVVVSGEATWLRHNWELKTLCIDGFEPPKSGSIRDALRRIREASGDAWDTIGDPDAFLAEMRDN
jgi:hypothetical protein